MHSNLISLTLLLIAFIFFAAIEALAQTYPSTVISNRKILRELENSGLSLSGLLSNSSPGSTAQFFNEHLGYQRIVETLAVDLENLRSSDPKLGIGMAWTHRLFDASWLKSPDAHFELIGVVPRFDRRIFHPESCGEMRFIYRLAYEQKNNSKIIRSFLPLTVNLVFWVPGPREVCAETVAHWLKTIEMPEGSRASALLARNALLSADRLKVENLKSLEVNLQAIRWPSTVRPEFGNHAEYLMRVFTFPSAQTKTPVLGRLENTPDVPHLLSSQSERNELLQWILNNHEKLDRGTVAIPEKFTTQSVLSIAPRGHERISNKPYSRLFNLKDFEKLDYSRHHYTKTPAAFLRRLNDLSCNGCHQQRSVAGFHFLGEKREEDIAANSLAVRGSPHFLADLARRNSFMDQIARGENANDSHPLSERSDGEPGKYGSRCGLGDPSFSSWTCESPLICTNIGDSLVGECFPAELGKTGDPCELSVVNSSPNPRTETTKATSNNPQCEGVCESTSVGFPRGMCSNSCNANTEGAVCGGIANLIAFNLCLAKQTPFDECLSTSVRPGELKACDEQSPCRDDYVCASISSQTGGCIPPYFLFQLRVDGHPTGKTGVSGWLRDRVERALR